MVNNLATFTFPDADSRKLAPRAHQNELLLRKRSRSSACINDDGSGSAVVRSALARKLIDQYSPSIADPGFHCICILYQALFVCIIHTRVADIILNRFVSFMFLQASK